MTLRRFMVLVRGLGPNSATATFQAGRSYIGGGQGVRIRETHSPEETEGALAAFFGGKVH